MVVAMICLIGINVVLLAYCMVVTGDVQHLREWVAEVEHKVINNKQEIGVTNRAIDKVLLKIHEELEGKVDKINMGKDEYYDEDWDPTK